MGTDYPTPDGTCLRDYIHVTDLAVAHVLALRRLESGGASQSYNLGTERPTSVRDVLAAVERVTGRRVATPEAPRRPGDPAVLYASAALAQRGARMGAGTARASTRSSATPGGGSSNCGRFPRRRSR